MPPNGDHSRSTIPRCILLVFLLTVISGAVTYLCLRIAQGTIAGYLVLIPLLALPGALSARLRSMARALLTLLALLFGFTLVLCIFSDLALVNRLRTACVLITWTLAVLGLGMGLVPRPGRHRGTVRTTLLAFAALLWATSPVWTGPTLAEHGLDWSPALSAIHPVFATNATATAAGIWSQQPVAYRITPLGQGVDYALPETVWPFVLVHLFAFAIGLMVRRIRSRRFS